jgi:hypothetical protein
LIFLTKFSFFLWYWGLNSRPTPQVTPPATFCEGFFRDRVSQTICLGWLQTLILLISASWVARITGMSHQSVAITSYFLLPKYNQVYFEHSFDTGLFILDLLQKVLSFREHSFNVWRVEIEVFEKCFLLVSFVMSITCVLFDSWTFKV